MASRDVRARLGQRIRTLREQRGLSQETLGYRAEIHRTYIGAVERGEQNISILNIERIAKALNVSLGELFGVFR
ncbi:MAG: HTH domain-containing protein, XRE family [Parcubacteria group bacterium Gr01-1014_38]|nr:MAG: HTH domain-containing protein, XRE family [Parcubacteria group bacterium Gr01-1014_38]